MKPTIRPLKSVAIPLMGLALVALIAGCSSSNDNGGGYGMPQVTQSIAASDQTDNPTNRVIVTQVKSASAGWVVIHEANGSTFGDAIGHVAVPSGTSTNVAVTLDREIVDGETLYAVLHDDLGQAGAFEFPGSDVPATQGGQVIKDSFVVHLQGTVQPSIVANAQTLNSLSTQVLVASAVSDGPGWATIHEQTGGTVGADIGHALLSSGTNQNITVTLNRPAIDGEMLYAMLHTDLGTVGTYEFPGVDAPVSVSGDIVMTPFVVTVPSGTPAIRLRVSSVGTTAYKFSQVEPAAFAGMLGAGGNNPALTLRSGWRYEFTNTVSGPHPFELLTRGGTPSTDVVLLSEAGSGSREADAGIAWSDNGQGRLRFTLSPSLAAVLTGYRCAAHPASMRGAVVIQ
jgi:hypothetical protein